MYVTHRSDTHVHTFSIFVNKNVFLFSGDTVITLLVQGASFEKKEVKYVGDQSYVRT